jgi:hypothetical protein
VANTLNGGEVKTVVLLNITGDLTVGVPWSPGLGDVPVKLVDPLARTVGGYSTIGITGEEEHAVLASEDGVDPEGSLIETVVVELVRAHLPSLNVARDVESVSHFLGVHVIGGVVTESVGALVEKAVGPRSVFAHGHTLLVGLEFTINHGGAKAGVLSLEVVAGTETTVVNGSVEIVPVQVHGELVDTGPGDVTDGRVLDLDDVVERVVAIVFIEGIEQVLGDNSVPEDGGRERWRNIISPVGGTVGNHETLEVDELDVGVDLVLLVVLIDLPGEVRNVDTTVTLTRDEKLVLLKLRELSVERLESSEGILGLLHIVGVPVSFGTSNGVTNTSRGLDVENVLLTVP